MAARTPAPRPKPFAIEVHATAAKPLGMAPATFLRDYWQKRPLLIRNAFADFQTPVTPEDLAGLACEDGVLARLIEHDRGTDGWRVRTGPFQEAVFPALPEQDWTLLVQDVDKWDPDVRALIARFDFLPRWRMDDVMISFAAAGGSVGAHVDQYDVFLLQGHGHRRWQIDASESTKGKRPALDFRPDIELKQLTKFKPTHDWVLAPGDMLYLPPNVPHNGVAEDACLTFSFGMRAPASAELISDYLDTLVVDADESIRYQDPDLKLPEDPNEIDVAAMNRVVAALNAIRMNDPDKLGDWFGRFITTYRAAGEVMPSGPAPSLDEVDQALAHGLLLERHPWARLAWRRAKRGASLYCSGLDLSVPVKDAQRIAAAERLDEAAWRGLSAKGRQALQELMVLGFYQLTDPRDTDDEQDDVLDASAEVVAAVETVETIEVDDFSDDVREVNVHEDGVEVVVSFDEDDEEDEQEDGAGQRRH
ncbi:cupin domain-containing protein [Stenotrophomonas sp. CFBP 13725]|uniref:ribosomal protein uL16 3-hydroxylase n=1 Tax=Stenotrophomonas sp. CFBP 13725 TaxID=2775297 RepID=UPI001787786C|nr:cupin domain-containing protein [Stenotrophomonas sp. CFBP 13725]MBD8634860.1 cupin domain-containing protein [Stenotrophomonas sp. CFBP 13725]